MRQIVKISINSATSASGTRNFLGCYRMRLAGIAKWFWSRISPRHRSASVKPWILSNSPTKQRASMIMPRWTRPRTKKLKSSVYCLGLSGSRNWSSSATTRARTMSFIWRVSWKFSGSSFSRSRRITLAEILESLLWNQISKWEEIRIDDLRGTTRDSVYRKCLNRKFKALIYRLLGNSYKWRSRSTCTVSKLDWLKETLFKRWIY